MVRTRREHDQNVPQFISVSPPKPKRHMTTSFQHRGQGPRSATNTMHTPAIPQPSAKTAPENLSSASNRCTSGGIDPILQQATMQRLAWTRIGNAHLKAMPCAVAGSNLSCYTLGCSKPYTAYPAGGASSRHDACLIGEGGSVGLARRGPTEKHSTCCVTFVVNVGAALDVIRGSLRGRMFVRHRKRLEIVGLDANFAVQGCRDVRTSLVPAPTRRARLTSSNNKSMTMYSPSLSVGRMFRKSCTVKHCQRSVLLLAMKIIFR
jgi:hypothetical protein